jgi:uncharacterized protein (TIGR02453 family)
MPRRYFTPETFTFLEDLAENNDREWFTANQDRYERRVREPALDFIADFAEPLASISEHFTADTRKAGGSLFRIQRDTRFSRDKTPYKTNTGMHFRHVAARDVHAPGFYLHIEPGACFAGVGIWRPEAAVAGRIRTAIADDPDGWVAATTGGGFRETWSLEGEMLKRPPRGFDPEHPLIDDLRRKDFVASVPLTRRRVTSAGWLEDYAGLCRAGAPFMAFLCRALGLAF